MDYSGIMGVPITFLDKYNPEQFEIIDAIGRYSMIQGPTPETQGKYLTDINGQHKYARILIRRRQPSASTYPQPEETTLMAAEKQEGYGKG